MLGCVNTGFLLVVLRSIIDHCCTVTFGWYVRRVVCIHKTCFCEQIVYNHRVGIQNSLARLHPTADRRQPQITPIFFTVCLQLGGKFILLRALRRDHLVLMNLQSLVGRVARIPRRGLSSSRLEIVGDVARAERSFTAADVQAFAELTGDRNPLHADKAFASSHQFGEPVVHGMLYACMFGAIIGQRSPGAVYLSQTLEFRKPVRLGAIVTAEIEVQRVAARGRILDFQTRCLVGSELVLSGSARVMMPRDSTSRKNIRD